MAKGKNFFFPVDTDTAKNIHKQKIGEKGSNSHG